MLTYERIQGRDVTSSLISTFLNSITFQWPFLVSLSDKIICVSNGQREIIVNKNPHLINKIEVIYNPLPECDPIEIQGDDYGYLGGDTRIKGFHVLHSAIKEVNKNKLPITLHATNFSRIPKTSIIFDNAKIKFYPKLQSELLNGLYKKLRAIVFPSVCPEPSPYVPIETLLKGRIVIASDLSGLREIAGTCKGAFFFEPGNSKALAEQIEYVSGLSREVIADITAQSRTTFSQNFSDEKTFTNFNNLCNKLLS